MSKQVLATIAEHAINLPRQPASRCRRSRTPADATAADRANASGPERKRLRTGRRKAHTGDWGQHRSLPEPARHLLHQFPMDDAAPSRPDQRHVRSPVVRCNLDVPSYVTADLTTPVGSVHVPVIAACFELAAVLGQNIRSKRCVRNCCAPLGIHAGQIDQPSRVCPRQRTCERIRLPTEGCSGLGSTTRHSRTARVIAPEPSQRSSLGIDRLHGPLQCVRQVDEMLP